ncbi:hypothetical protein ACFO9Q_20630 [Paenibacillus sp. GCM10023252]|uniref:hypothetical protein n=1 Tax=Paenibacillus sp. GCM10023252 TaxID=3252649 RepID=UPI00360C151C
MKFSYSKVLIALLFTLSGCSMKQADPTTLVTLDQVEEAFRTEGIQLVPKQLSDDWKIRKVKANQYVVDNTQPYDQIFIYIFASEEARKDGRKNFDKQKEKEEYNHDIYESKNVLVVYWNQESSKDTSFSKTAMDALHKS